MIDLLMAGALACAPACPLSADTVPVARRLRRRARASWTPASPAWKTPASAWTGGWTRRRGQGAAVLTGFTQSTPAEGIPARERTEVLVFYTPRELFIGVRAHASDPSSIRSTLAERDQITADDHVRILLDTFHDRRRAFALFVNPLGIQQDGTFSDGRGHRLQFSPDFVFDSRGRLTGEGYEVEIRIPLRSIKFPSGGTQTWGLNVIRVIPAAGAEESWAPRSRNQPAELASSGVLSGIQGLRPGRLVEVNPTFTARREGTTDEDGFRRGPTEPDVGVNLKYGITSELTLDATHQPGLQHGGGGRGPDHGQRALRPVAAGEAAVLPGRRGPVLHAGGAGLHALHRGARGRRARHGQGGRAEPGLAGRRGRCARATTPPATRRSRARALVQIGRLRRDVGQGSTVGLLATSRVVGGAFNHVAAADARFRFGRAYMLGGQVGGSWTRSWQPDAAGTDSAGAPGARVPVALDDRAAHIGQVYLDRTARHWGYLVTLRDVPADFVTETGFVRRTGITSHLRRQPRLVVRRAGRPGGRAGLRAGRRPSLHGTGFLARRRGRGG